jgi:putative nucleotide binding protein
MERKRYESYAYVLDHIPQGTSSSIRLSFKAEALVQLLGEDYFTLLEAVAKPRVIFSNHEKVYVGKEGVRDKILHIIGRLEYVNLSSSAKSELPIVIEEIVRNSEARFTEFFNKAQTITPRMHSLELVPGIGKKYMWQILNEREKVPFKDLQDLRNRTSLPDPIKLIVNRIMEELMEEPKYRLFTRLP